MTDRAMNELMMETIKTVVLERQNYRARLVGGPCDGEIVEVVGVCWDRKLARKYRRGGPISFFHATYRWEYAGAELIGRFVGYFDGSRRVDSLGRKIRGLSRARSLKAA